MVHLEKTMFRAYDLRGQVNERELNEKSMYFIARGFATMLAKKKIRKCIVGMDARPYNSKLHNALVRGLTGSGINVLDIGMVTTPMSYFAQWHFNVKGVAMITASHNPNGWSGVKLGYGKSSTLLPKDIEKLYGLIVKEEFFSGEGKVEEKQIAPAYIKEITGKARLARPLKVVVNCRNGIAGMVAPKVLKALGCDVIEQYCDVDDSYPHGVANPSLDDMNLELGRKVVDSKADLGLSFDADGDRIGAVDENGQLIYPDRILALLSRSLLEKYPKSKIVFDIKSSQALPEDIKAHGGIPVMTMVGHSFVKAKVHSEKAGLGGEKSGHMFFVKNWYGFDDACLAAAKFLEYISGESKKLSAIVDTIPKYYSSPVIHAPCQDEIKYDVLKRVVACMKKSYPDTIDIDGVRVMFPDGWFLVRASSNLPVMVIGFEAKTKERLAEIEQLVRKELAAFPEISPNWRNG